MKFGSKLEEWSKRFHAEWGLAALPLICALATTAILIALHHVGGLAAPGSAPELVWVNDHDLATQATWLSADTSSRLRWGVSTAALWCAALAGLAASLWATRTTTGPEERPVWRRAVTWTLPALLVLGLVLDAFDLFFS